ncbi:fungal-specific transcription factor domain-containing protein [Pisolithus croceorrhizus]|nr:fungal-specific transcription factor domain-containing protein [Pisolithus croceorrhizus]KAI6144519.1 fungal-specific transcription factor domain-containing protein [Pisolithus thermaeus]
MDHLPHTRDVPSSATPPSHLDPRIPVAGDKPEPSVAFMKGPKRKRLAKACDACHKSKRRCDGTAPCSNCYFASKKCTYTDASGKPVPAPRPRPEASVNLRLVAYSPQDGSPPYGSLLPHPEDLPSPSEDDGSASARKRFRTDINPPASRSVVPPKSRAPPVLPASDRPLERDPTLTRELVHLFFAYRQPHRMIIHQPTFLADLTRRTVPPHLLLAVCAVAASLSKQPGLRTSPCRYAGEPFAQEAAALMFDENRNLTCEHNLATAQALCLLQLHDRMGKSLWAAQYHQHALDIVTGLGIFDHDHTVFTPIPSTESINASIERECARRVFWLIYISDCVASVLYGRNILATEAQLSLRLPMDETCFELYPHTATPEYMRHPSSPKVCSEIGQVIQIVSLHAQVEKTLGEFNNREKGKHPRPKLLELEQQVAAWVEALPDHLRFTDDHLLAQMNVYETGSNVGAWCFAAMHTFHNSCVLALNWARQRCRTAMPHDISGAQEKLHKIMNAWGEKGKLSILLGLILWPLFKYTDDRSPALLKWSSEFEEIWGVRIHELCSSSADSRQASLFLISHAPPPPVPSSSSSQNVNSRTRQSPVAVPPATLDPRFHSQVQQPLCLIQNSPQSSSSHSVDGRSHVVVGMADPREKDTTPMRVGHDGNIDPALTQAQGPATPANVQQAQQSLPSLKASGLLEWSHPSPGSATEVVSGVGAASAPSPSVWSSGGAQQLVPPPRSASGRDSGRSPHLQAQPTHSPSPPMVAAHSMPVGLPWLAHESTVTRQG